jgi:hypothetical protein
MGPRVDLGAVEKSETSYPCQVSKRDSSVVQSLYQLSYQGFFSISHRWKQQVGTLTEDSPISTGSDWVAPGKGASPGLRGG